MFVAVRRRHPIGAIRVFLLQAGPMMRMPITRLIAWNM
jgi:hypothetical protein